ncbi:Pre-mRNA-processing protein prp40 [Hondaea fermentalgiana]|uniref:Pre-mRNA-processing protein prp40 n=1 Tax=Hondaea fermentalgiana TaxID=2315210 RepID=A0A2R5G983_9STRA|nr:Pre-mRNA-processing protein prp40 [Hondaea fermentalgiana]|eukprot:GBG24234.1 Pre-mRNA-processing protein prp40 [Hondaea fermentalgiana]
MPTPRQSTGSARSAGLNVGEGERRKREFVEALWARSSSSTPENPNFYSNGAINNSNKYNARGRNTMSMLSPTTQIEECESLFSEAEDSTSEMVRDLPLALFRDDPRRTDSASELNHARSAREHSQQHTRRNTYERSPEENSGRMRPASAASRMHGRGTGMAAPQDRFTSQVEEIQTILSNRDTRSSLQKMLRTPTSSLSVELAKRKELDHIEQDLADKAALLERRKRELEAELEKIKNARKIILKEAARQNVSIGRLFKMRLREFYRLVRTNEIQYSRVAYREAAAITIQTAWRASLASEYVNVLRRAKGLQSRHRFPQFQNPGKASLQDLQEMLEALSGAQMDGIPTAVRQELKIALEKHLSDKAAVSLQKAFRGHRTRHVTVPRAKNYREEWQDFWSDEGKDEGSESRSRAGSATHRMGQYPTERADSMAASAPSRARTSLSFESYNEANYGASTNYENTSVSGSHAASASSHYHDIQHQQQQQQQQQQQDQYEQEVEGCDPVQTTGATPEQFASATQMGDEFIPEWSYDAVVQDESMPIQQDNQDFAGNSLSASQARQSFSGPMSPLSPTEVVSSAAGALQDSGFVCLTDLDDLSVLAAGMQLKMVRSDGSSTDVELLEVMLDGNRVRCKCGDGRVVAKKLKYFFTVPTELLALANVEESASHETVENVKALVGDWEICGDEEGNEFYYNRVTGQSVWEKPQEVLAAEVDGTLDDLLQNGNRNREAVGSPSRMSKASSRRQKRGKKKAKKSRSSFDMDELSEVTSPAVVSPSFDSNARYDVFF